MKRFNNYLLAIAGLVVFGGAVQFVIPLQAAPPAKDVNVVNTPLSVVVENGDGDATMVITLGEDLNATVEFPAVDVSGFRFVSFLAKGNFVGEQLQFRFLSESER